MFRLASYGFLPKCFGSHAIIGNPPYQVLDGGNAASAVPVYNRFVELSKSMGSQIISMVMPARWYAGGKGLDKFRNSMLSDCHLAALHDFYNARDLFNNVEIKGGICYFLWSKTWNEACHVHSHTEEGEIIESVRFLKNEDTDIFIRDPRTLSILKKVFVQCKQRREKSFDTIVSEMKPYGLRGDVFKNPFKYGLPKMSDKKIPQGITIIGLNENLKRVQRYVPADYPLPKKKGLENYKLFIPRNWGTGSIYDKPFKSHKAVPYEVCTETFLQVFPFASAEERDHCDKYMQTKFFRLLVSARKQDQGAKSDVYAYVPLQDFTVQSEICWENTPAQIDKQLYKKYGLTAQEIEFIEKLPPSSEFD